MSASGSQTAAPQTNTNSQSVTSTTAKSHGIEQHQHHDEVHHDEVNHYYGSPEEVKVLKDDLRKHKEELRKHKEELRKQKEGSAIKTGFNRRLIAVNRALRTQIQKKDATNVRLFRKYRKMRVFCSAVFKDSNDDFPSAKDDFETTVLIDLDSDDEKVLRNQFNPKKTPSKTHTKRRAKLAAKRKTEKHLISSSSLSTASSAVCCSSSSQVPVTIVISDDSDSDELQLFEGGLHRKKASKCHSAQTPVLSSISKSSLKSVTRRSGGALPRKERPQKEVVDDSAQRGDESASVHPRSTLQHVGGGFDMRKHTIALRQMAVGRPRVGHRPVVRGKVHGQVVATNGPMPKVPTRRSRSGSSSKKAFKPMRATLDTSSMRRTARVRNKKRKEKRNAGKCRLLASLGLAPLTRSKKRRATVSIDLFKEVQRPKKKLVEFSSSTDSGAEFMGMGHNQTEREHACSSSTCPKCIKSWPTASPKSTRKPESVLLSDDFISLDGCGLISSETDRLSLETETICSENEPNLQQLAVTRTELAADKVHGQFDAAVTGSVTEVQKRRSHSRIRSKALEQKSATLDTSSVRSSAPRKSPLLASASGRGTKCPSRGGLGLASKTCSKKKSEAVASVRLYETPNPRKMQRRKNSLPFSSSSEESDSDAEFIAEPRHCYGLIPRETDRLETETTSSENVPIMQWAATRTQLAADTSEQFGDASVPSIPAVTSPSVALRRNASGRSAVPPQTEARSKSGTLAKMLKPLAKISAARLFTRKSDGSRRSMAQPLANYQLVAETRKKSTARTRVGSSQVSRAPQKVGGLREADDVKSEERIDTVKSEALSAPQPVGAILTVAQFVSVNGSDYDDDVCDDSAEDTESSSEEDTRKYAPIHLPYFSTFPVRHFSATPIPDVNSFGPAAVSRSVVKAEASSSQTTEQSSSSEAAMNTTDTDMPKLEKYD